MSALAAMPTWLTRSDDGAVSAQAPHWLLDFRQKQWDAFVNNGLPTRQNERWKYADLSFLANKHFSAATYADQKEWRDIIKQHRLTHGDSILLVLVNGFFMPHFSDLDKLPKEVVALNFIDALKQHEALIKSHWPNDIDAQQYPFASLNAAMFIDGLFLYFPDHCEVTSPIHLLSLASDQHEFIAHPHHMILLGKHSKLKLVEEYIGLSAMPYMLNSMTHVFIGKESQLQHDKIQTESKNAVHLAHTFIKQMQDSHVCLTHFSSGSHFARDEVVVKLLEPGANCCTGGFYCLQEDNQYIDHHIDIDHAAPYSHSEMLYKGIIDKKSRAVFNGRLHVEKNAQKIVAYQANHNLLLSKEAEVYSKPELEIYADDVKCKHGASIGQIDQDALFYLRSRGISHREALSLLLQGFAKDILERLTHPGVRLRIEEMLSCKLI